MILLVRVGAQTTASLRLRIAGNLFTSWSGSTEREEKKRNEQKLKAVVHSRIMAKEQEVASAERLAEEGGITSDKSANEVLEIVANEGPAEEHNERA